MGSNANDRRAHAVRASRKADRTNPLRRVVDVVEKEIVSRKTGEVVGYVDREVLECGHEHRPSQSYHGSYAGEAKKRRCKRCAIWEEK